MARLAGRRPDRTGSIARRLRSRLGPGEEVLAGVDTLTPGSVAAGMAGATGGAHAAAVGSPVTPTDAGSEQHRTWMRQADRVGIDPELARRAVGVHLVLTSARLLLVRRSRLTGRPREILTGWPLDVIEAIDVPRRGQSVTITVDGEKLRLELPTAHKFLPDVYRELPDRWAAARDEL